MSSVSRNVAAHARLTSPPAPARRLPSLESGDRLTRIEFERRFTAMPDVKKAELIEGEVYMPSPVRHEEHARPHIRIAYWIMSYVLQTRGVDAGDNGTVRLDSVNEPQPDVYLRILPRFGGRTRLSEGYIEGAPELVVEVAASSVSIDLHRKLAAYERNGVREYVVWRVEDEAVDWFSLVEDRFRPLAPDAAGIVRSEVFPGLRLDPAALVRDDMARVLAVLQEGLASPEHSAFVASLATKETPEPAPSSPPAPSAGA